MCICFVFNIADLKEIYKQPIERMEDVESIIQDQTDKMATAILMGRLANVAQRMAGVVTAMPTVTLMKLSG